MRQNAFEYSIFEKKNSIEVFLKKTLILNSFLNFTLLFFWGGGDF